MINRLNRLTILELNKELRDDVLHLKALKEERMKEVIELKSVDEQLCDKLKMEPMYVPTKVVPTDEQLEGLKKHIRDMKVSQLSFRNLDIVFVEKLRNIH